MALPLRVRVVWLAVAVLAGSWGISSVGATASADVELETLASQPLDAFIEGSYGVLVRCDPDSVWDADGRAAAAYGVESYAALTDISAAALAETHRLEAEILRLLHAFPTADLSPEVRLSYDAYEWLLEDRLAAVDYPYWDYSIGPSTYGVHNRQLQLFNILPIRDIQDARDYVARLRGMETWMSQLRDGLRTRETAGFVPPLYVLQLATDEITAGVLQDDATTPDPRIAEAYTTFDARLAAVAELTAAERATLLADSEAAIRDVVVPAFRALRADLVRLQAVAGSAVGVGRFPGGKDYYACLLRHYVGTSADADKLHAMGLTQVARIEDELRTFALAEFGWPRDLPIAELNTRIQNEKAEYLEGDALQARYAELLEEAWDSYDVFFTRRPETGLAFFVDPTAPPAYYQSPALDGSAPALFVVSLANAAVSTMYDDAVLTYHETVPGHHVQFGLTLDLDLPSFRTAPIVPLYAQHPAFQAFTEGWALYGEHLAAEMGLYDDDPVGNLWRLRLELTRAVRLVADTGMNALGWTWAEAAAYLESALGVRQRQSVLLRYESAPGQACGYNVGYFTLLELRQRAMDRLGDAFDIRKFHEAVLGHGALPLEILERVVDAWIESEAGEP